MRYEFLCNSAMLIILCLAATNQAPWPLLLLLLLPLLLHTWLIPGGFAWRKLAFFHNHPTPPGPVGWPFIGSVTVMRSLAHRRLADLSTSLSADRLMALSLGPTPVVVSSHPDTAREILCSPAFSDRPSKGSARLLMFERAIGFAPSGDYWRQLRRLAAANFFSPRRIMEMEGVRVRVAERAVKEVEEEMDRRGVVGLRGVLQRGSLGNILGCVFGDALRREEREELEEMVREGYELIGTFNFEDYFPLWGVLDFNGVGRRCRVLAERVRVLVGGIIEERRRTPTRSTDHASKKNDFLSVLLSLPEEEKLSDSDVVAVIWEMVIRGADVVAILLEWIMARMVLHPTIQAKARQELALATGARPVNDSDIQHLRYLHAIVKEVLRLHPPGPLLSWARLATRDVHVGKYFVPAGTTAMVNMWAITHDERIWKNQAAFRPERFLEDGDVNVMGSDLRLAPFGSGRRVCPGRALGLATVELLLAKLLQEFVWVPDPDRPVNLSERLNLSMEMKIPLVCSAVRRSPV